VLGLLARSFPTYPQRLIAVDVADAPFPLGGITSAFGYDQFEHWKMMAQHWLDGGQDTPDHENEAILCKACAGLHFINRKTGKLLGQDDEEEE
jgi:hypothetical protein